MKVIERGHIYQPKNRQEDENCKDQTIRFINKQPGEEHGGTTTQEVIRCLIDRTRHCNNCLPHPNNERIIYHLRMALVLHECRALERKVEKGEITPEYVVTGHDGHYSLTGTRLPEELDTHYLESYSLTIRPNY